MTTILSLASRDFIVVGCDSLATYSSELIDPGPMFKKYFDQTTGKLLTDATGAPLLDATQLFTHASSYPVNQLPSVTKLFDLTPKRAALLFAGVARVGDLSVKNLVETFKHDKKKFIDYKNYTIQGLAERLRDHVLAAYQQQIPVEAQRPGMEILVSGYSSSQIQPEVFKLTFNYNWTTSVFEAEVFPMIKRGQYDVAFGGQYDVIERVVKGLDFESFLSLRSRCQEIVNEYKSSIEKSLAAANVSFTLPPIDHNSDDFNLFAKEFGGVRRIFTDVGSLSEQAGIDFVTFLIQTMIKSQEFSASIPTVGGDIHIGLLTTAHGFQWISKEEYKAQDHSIPKFGYALHK